MKISTEISSIAKHVGEEKAVELVAKAGFDAYDFSMFAPAEKINPTIRYFKVLNIIKIQVSYLDFKLN